MAAVRSGTDDAQIKACTRARRGNSTRIVPKRPNVEMSDARNGLIVTGSSKAQKQQHIHEEATPTARRSICQYATLKATSR